MNSQLAEVQKEYKRFHPGVKIKIDILPTEEQERDVYLQQLRTEILQGKGPDCYLLPTDNTVILDKPVQYTYVNVTPLFDDIDLAMRNGLFYDISELYDLDSHIDKNGLNEAIMNSGVVDGKRYVLPLRYDIPVIYALTEEVESRGLNPAVLTEDIGTIMEAVYETGDPLLAGGILCYGYNIFSNFIDYDTGKVTLDSETLSRYLTAYQKLKSLLGDEFIDCAHGDTEDIFDSVNTDGTALLESLDVKKFIYCEYGKKAADANPSDPVTEYYPLWIGSMQDVFNYVPVADYKAADLGVTPMRSIGNEIIATVSYYAAVGSGTENPDLAYDFVSLFLGENLQLEVNRPERDHTKPLKGDGPNTSNDLQYPGLIENGWPVMDKNSLQALWKIRRLQIYVRELDPSAGDEQERRMRQIGLLGELDEDIVPLFDIEISQVRYNTGLSADLSEATRTLNDSANGNAPTDVNIKELAEQLIWELCWHVSEG